MKKVSALILVIILFGVGIVHFSSHTDSASVEKMADVPPAQLGESQEIQVKTPVTAGHTITQLPDATKYQTLSKMSDEVLSQLPKTSELKNLSNEDVHTTPTVIFKGALQLKRFSDLFELELKATVPNSENEKKLTLQGIDFYKTCAANSEMPESIRAVCFVEFIKLAEKAGLNDQIAKVEIPLRVIQIAQSIVQ